MEPIADLPVNTMFNGTLAFERDHGKAYVLDTFVVEESLDRLTHHIGKFAGCAGRFADYTVVSAYFQLTPDKRAYELSILAGNLL